MYKACDFAPLVCPSLRCAPLIAEKDVQTYIVSWYKRVLTTRNINTRLPSRDVSTSPSRFILINTSYNYHGEPIVYSVRDAINTHIKQTSRAIGLGWKLRPTTIIVTEEE